MEQFRCLWITTGITTFQLIRDLVYEQPKKQRMIIQLKRIAQGSGAESGNTYRSESEKGSTAVADKLVKQQIKAFIKTREGLVFGFQ